MKKLFTLSFIALAICFSTNLLAQTTGTFTFSFTPTTQSPGYSGTKNVLAVWIESSTGTFIKTKLRYWGSGTSDHLPTWKTKSASNTTDATTGATLSSFTAKTVIWDGKNVSGTANGSLVADGSYKIWIQETWNHGTTGTTITSFTFTKGPTADHQTPANTSYFTNIKLDWVPASTTGIEDVSANSDINVFPNPTKGVFNVEYKAASNIRVVNTLGAVVYEEKIEQAGAETKNIDLSNFANGIYIVNVFNGEESSNFKVLLNK